LCQIFLICLFTLSKIGGSNTSKSFVHTTESLPQNGALFEGDIIMTDELRKRLLCTSRSCLDGRNSAWDGWDENSKTVIIPYTSDDKFDKTHGDMLKDAFDKYEKYTCIRFKKKDDEKNYINFRSDGDGCSSKMGMQGGRQNVTLGKGCSKLGIFIHEIMHALGFMHEHERPDRDDYVEILFDHIDKKEHSQFEKYGSPSKGELLGQRDYNLNSIMHYKNDDFTKNGLLSGERQTIRSKKNPNLKFGQRENFSKGDARSINEKYCVYKVGTMVQKYNEPELYEDLMRDTNGDFPTYVTDEKAEEDYVVEKMRSDEKAREVVAKLEKSKIFTSLETLEDKLETEIEEKDDSEDYEHVQKLITRLKKEWKETQE